MRKIIGAILVLLAILLALPAWEICSHLNQVLGVVAVIVAVAIEVGLAGLGFMIFYSDPNKSIRETIKEEFSE